MGKRGDILKELKTIFESSNIFVKVYTAQTDYTKEKSFPICWLLLGDETSEDASLSTKFRKPSLTIRAMTKNNLGEDSLNDLLDSIISLMDSNYTINNTVINSDFKFIVTDEGVLFPIAAADVSYELMMR